jgi:hypothetical protein
MKKRVLYGFLKDQRASVAVITAITLIPILITAGLVTDLGRLYVIKAELQNAADAGALAGAEALFNPSFNSAYLPQRPRPYHSPYPYPVVPSFFPAPHELRPVPAVATEGQFRLRLTFTTDEPIETVTHCEMARAAARAAVMANRADGQYLVFDDEDAQLGTYAYSGDGGNWEFTPSECSNNTNAVRVITRKTTNLNGPVNMIFAKVLGVDYVELSAQSVAMLGWVKGIGKGRGTFPLALGDKYVPPPGEKMLVTFSTNWSDSGGWHTFFDPSSSAIDLRKLVNRTTPSPEIKCADMIHCTNGVDASVVQEMHDQFYRVHNGNWTIILPVIPADSNYLQARKVIGFCAFEVIEVKGPPEKTVKGYAVGGYILPKSEAGGPDMGLRASLPKLAH